MPFFTSPVQSPAVPACQNPSVASRAPETHFYRPRGNPFQKLPKSIHSHSHSLSASSIFSSSSCASTHTNSPQDIVARILAQDEVPRGTFMAAEKEKAKSKRGPAPGPVQVHVQQQTTTTSTASTTATTRTSTEEKKTYPERLDSRRALLSVINGPKAPIVFKGFGAPASNKSTSSSDRYSNRPHSHSHNRQRQCRICTSSYRLLPPLRTRRNHPMSPLPNLVKPSSRAALCLLCDLSTST
ncbi:hypothetical protein CPB86DRAFT_170960 [Serendipita vermifera]|nr:hypothetical protein CPB86DRAFT_170960 [Serendipita vermifera]